MQHVADIMQSYLSEANDHQLFLTLGPWQMFQMIILILLPENEREIVVKLMSLQGRRESKELEQCDGLSARNQSKFWNNSPVCSGLQHQVVKSSGRVSGTRKRFFSCWLEGSRVHFSALGWTVMVSAWRREALFVDCTFVEWRRRWRRLGIPSLSHQTGKPEFDKVTSQAFKISFPVWTLSFGMDTAAYATKKSRQAAGHQGKASWFFKLQVNALHSMSARKANQKTNWSNDLMEYSRSRGSSEESRPQALQLRFGRPFQMHDKRPLDEHFRKKGHRQVHWRRFIC